MKNFNPAKSPDEKVGAEPAARPEGGPAEAPETPSQNPGAPTRSDAPAAGAVQISREEYEQLVQKANERELYRNELLRSRADFDNYQKRIQKEKPQIAEQALRRFALDLLPVLDNFDRALGGDDATVGSIRSGILIVRQMFLKALADNGFSEIDALGKPFDPVLHDAVVHEETVSYPPGTVSGVMAKGYLHRGMVVRPAQVKVARAPVTVPDSLPESLARESEPDAGRGDPGGALKQ